MKNKYTIQTFLRDTYSTTLSPVDERSLENSPVSTPTAGTGDHETHSNNEPTLEKASEVSLGNVNDDIKNHINNLISKNLELELQNKTFKEELLHKQRFITELQEQYDDCIDTIVTLRDTIHKLESGQMDTNYLDEHKFESEMYKRNIKELEKDCKLWRVRSNLLDLDNDDLKQKIKELKEDKPTMNISNTKKAIHKGDSCSKTDSACGDSLTLKRDNAEMEHSNDIDESPPQNNISIPKITLRIPQSESSKLPQLHKSRLIPTPRPFTTARNVLLPHPPCSQNTIITPKLPGPDHSYCPKIMRPATPSIRNRYLPKVNFPLPCPFKLPSPPKTLKQNPTNPKWKI